MDVAWLEFRGTIKGFLPLSEGREGRVGKAWGMDFRIKNMGLKNNPGSNSQGNVYF
jgi:hypothetical protein